MGASAFYRRACALGTCAHALPQLLPARSCIAHAHMCFVSAHGTLCFCHCHLGTGQASLRLLCPSLSHPARLGGALVVCPFAPPGFPAGPGIHGSRLRGRSPRSVALRLSLPGCAPGGLRPLSGPADCQGCHSLAFALSGVGSPGVQVCSWRSAVTSVDPQTAKDVTPWPSPFRGSAPLASCGWPGVPMAPLREAAHRSCLPPGARRRLGAVRQGRSRPKR